MAGEPHSTAASSSRNRANRLALYVTYVNIVLYALCFQFQRPVEPFLVQELLLQKQTSNNNVVDTSNNNVRRTYGQLQSFFSIIQTIGSPLAGILLDRFGVRNASVAVFLSSALSYQILSNAHTMQSLFYSKIPTILQHAFLVAQATAATSTAGDESARAQALGRMTTAYTLGATLGPALGGFLASNKSGGGGGGGGADLYLGARLAVWGSLLSVLLSLLFLPNTGTISHQKDREDDNDNKSNKTKRSLLQDLRHSGALALRSGLWPLLLVKVVGGMAASMHSTALPMVLTQDLHFDPAALGLTMSSSMLAVAAFGAIAMAPLMKFLGGAVEMAQSGLALRAILGLTMAAIVSQTVATSVAGNSSDMVKLQVITAGVLHGLASHALATGLTTKSTGIVAKEEQGALLGLEHGLFSLARIGGPPLGTTLLGWTTIGFWAVASACGFIDVSLLAVLFWAAAPKPLKPARSNKQASTLESESKYHTS